VDEQEFCDRLRDRLSPGMYPGGEVPNPSPFALLLRGGHWWTTRYAFAVLPWAAVEDKSGLLAVARAGVKRHIVTVPYLVPVGLYLVICGPASGWAETAPGVKADQTGFHSVIVQGVHFLDLTTGAHVMSRSEWGPIRFGGTTSVSEVVNSVVAAERRRP
jgi:hypothetical protein